MEVDAVVVGSGLTGAIIAKTLHETGKSVVVLERRPHVGGNVHDHAHPSGIRVHTYGPHYFRTNNQKIWDFVNSITPFFEYRPVVKTFVDGAYENWPVNNGYIQRLLDEQWVPGFQGEPENFEEASLRLMPSPVYERFVKGYSEKQWGVRATELSTGLARRFEVRDDDNPSFLRHRFQGIPSEGYAVFTERLLAGIPVVLNCDYLKHRSDFRARNVVVYTGPIDAFFDHDLGRLAYRGQRRDHTHLRDTEYALPCGQVNNPAPDNGPHIRTLEWKHMMEPQYASAISGTVLTTETPYSPIDPDCYEYPFPDARNADLYAAYRSRADALDGVVVCGRLGDYRYYDMDHAIARARWLARKLLRSWDPS